jgi:hypothetical protein
MVNEAPSPSPKLKRRATPGTVRDEPLRVRAEDFADKSGSMLAAATALGLNRNTFAYFVNGMPVQKGTLAALREALAKVETPAAESPAAPAEQLALPL